MCVCVYVGDMCVYLVDATTEADKDGAEAVVRVAIVFIAVSLNQVAGRVAST